MLVVSSACLLVIDQTPIGCATDRAFPADRISPFSATKSGSRPNRRVTSAAINLSPASLKLAYVCSQFGLSSREGTDEQYAGDP